LVEFMPAKDYLKDPDTVARWGYHLTSVGFRMRDLDKRLERSKRLVSGEEDMILSPSGEEGVSLLKALCGLGDRVSNVILPNTAGQIANLPVEAVVESNADFSYDNVVPVEAGLLADEILALTEPHILNQADVLNAVMNSEREAVYRAFLREPLTCGYPEQKLRRLAEDMIAMTMGEGLCVA